MNNTENLHPGPLLRVELEKRGLGQRELARKIGISRTILNLVLLGKRPLSPEIAIQLCTALVLDPETYLQMQIRYDLHQLYTDPTMRNHLQYIPKYPSHQPPSPSTPSQP